MCHITRMFYNYIPIVVSVRVRWEFHTAARMESAEGNEMMDKETSHFFTDRWCVTFRGLSSVQIHIVETILGRDASRMYHLSFVLYYKQKLREEMRWWTEKWEPFLKADTRVIFEGITSGQIHIVETILGWDENPTYYLSFVLYKWKLLVEMRSQRKKIRDTFS